MKNLLKAIWRVVFKKHSIFWGYVISYIVCFKLIIYLTKDFLVGLAAPLIVVSLVYIILIPLYNFVKVIIHDIKMEKKILDYKNNKIGWCIIGNENDILTNIYVDEIYCTIVDNINAESDYLTEYFKNSGKIWRLSLILGLFLFCWNKMVVCLSKNIPYSYISVENGTVTRVWQVIP